MVKHMIIWKLKDFDTDEEKIAAAQRVKAGLEGLKGQIDGLEEITVYIDILPSSTGSMMLDSTFTTEAALLAYRDNPKHVAVATYVRSVVQERLCVDYQM